MAGQLRIISSISQAHHFELERFKYITWSGDPLQVAPMLRMRQHFALWLGRWKWGTRHPKKCAAGRRDCSTQELAQMLKQCNPGMITFWLSTSTFSGYHPFCVTAFIAACGTEDNTHQVVVVHGDSTSPTLVIQLIQVLVMSLTLGLGPGNHWGWGGEGLQLHCLQAATNRKWRVVPGLVWYTCTSESRVGKANAHLRASLHFTSGGFSLWRGGGGALTSEPHPMICGQWQQQPMSDV